jgi:hypothetical protein
MRWSEAGYLSQFVLAHVLRQASVSLILDVRQKQTMEDPAPSFGSRCIYTASAWSVALLAVAPLGDVSVVAFPLGLGFAILSRGDFMAGAMYGWFFYFLVTIGVFLPERHKSFRYAFYALVIALVVNIGGSYRMAHAL